MKTRISIYASCGIIAACATLLAPTLLRAAVTNIPPQLSTILQGLQSQLDEQTKRIDRLYKAMGPQLTELEERAALLEKQQQEDKALALDTICRVADESLSGIGANNSTATEFGVLTTAGTVRIYNGSGKLVKEIQPSK